MQCVMEEQKQKREKTFSFTILLFNAQSINFNVHIQHQLIPES